MFKRWAESRKKRRMERLAREVTPLLEEGNRVIGAGLVENVRQRVENGDIQSDEELRREWAGQPNDRLRTAASLHIGGLEQMLDRRSFLAAAAAVRDSAPLPPELEADPVVAEVVRRLRLFADLLRERQE